MNARTVKDLKRAASFVTQEQCRRFITRATYRRLNDRRGDLIARLYSDGLSAADRDVLDALEGEVDRLVDTACPLPPITWTVTS